MSTRILTHRQGREWEAIEKDAEYFQWKGEYIYNLTLENEGNICKIVYHMAGFGYPVDEEFVKEKFIECGRIYDSQR